MATFNITFADDGAYNVTFGSNGDSFIADVGTVIAPPIYQGEYSFTPGDEPQTIATGGYALTQDITIQPIPSNYGLITWNGSTLTVS